MTDVMKESELSARERMVRSAGTLIRSKGVHGTGLREIVASASAPRGSLQHYFPGGKDQLVAEGVLWMGGVAAHKVWQFLDELERPTPSALFAAIVDDWRQILLRQRYQGGCPLLAAGVDVAGTSETLRDAVRRAFQGWQEPLERALAETGVAEDRVASLAVLLISALEGAILLARVRHDPAPLDAVVDELTPVLDHATRRRP